MADLQTITLEHEGAVLEGQLALPEGPGPHPAVLVMHNAHGLGRHMREEAQALAAQGYAALATDMYGGGQYFANNEEAGVVLMPFWQDNDKIRVRAVAWHDKLKSLAEVDATRTAAIGYCFGGQCVLELARSGADVRVIASYHGLLNTSQPAQPGAVKAHVAVFTGTEDPWAQRDAVEALRAEMAAAKARWQITEYGGVFHAFTDPYIAETAQEGIRYDAIAAASSWAATLALLSETLRS